jgi:predicted dinucleotide-binding enzyme
MKLGILGGGNVGGALGHAWARAGHDIVFGVREPSGPDMRKVLGRCQGRARAGDANEAAQFGDVIVNALPWAATRDVVPRLNLKGKVVLDAANPLLPDLAGLEVGTTSSAGEQVAQWAPGAKVVKIFNSTGSNNMENPVYDGKPITLFYCGDDADAKSTAAQLARDVGFDPVDAGPLKNSRLLEPLAMLWIWLAYPGGRGREFAFQIVKR